MKSPGLSRQAAISLVHYCPEVYLLAIFHWGLSAGPSSSSPSPLKSHYWRAQLSRLLPGSKPDLLLPIQSAARKQHSWSDDASNDIKWYFCLPFRVFCLSVSLAMSLSPCWSLLQQDGVHDRFFVTLGMLWRPVKSPALKSVSRWIQIWWETWRILQVILRLSTLNCNNYAVFPSMRRKTDRRSFLSQKYPANSVKRELRDEKEQDGICGASAEALVGVNRPLLTDADLCRSSTRQQNAFPGSIIK